MPIPLISVDFSFQRSTRARLAVGLLGGCAVCGMTGCRSVQASMLPMSARLGVESLSTHDAELIVDDAGGGHRDARWPSRWGNNPDKRGVILELDRPWSEFRSAHLGRHHTMRSSEIEYADASALARAVGMKEGFKFKPEGPGSFLFVPRVEKDQPGEPELEPEMAFKFVSARQEFSQPRVMTGTIVLDNGDEFEGKMTVVRESNDGVRDDQDFVRLERTWFTFHPPQNPDELLGTIVILPGMFGTPEPVINSAEVSFQSYGWAVVRMMSHPSGFTAHKRVVIEKEREAEIAAEIALEYDQRTAECAYASDAALEYVFDAHPELGELPVVLLGMSGGAMVLPTVYAYSPDRYDAAVLVAGGGNSMLISAMSSYKEMIDAVRLDYDASTTRIDGKPTREILLGLSEAYLKVAKLDPIITAKEMHNIPVLMLHAKNDKAVPAKRGVDLYNALGRPERWQYPVGHELIFAALPAQFGRINRWLKDELDLQTAAPDPVSSPAESP
ncbi:MAG: hypothetical protein JKY96_01725 [Phycisphaerales bacterium]|nr:hypothetical protein [Phycisphaerales bacterium]